MYATSVNSAAYDGPPGGNSPFTTHLLNNLEDHDLSVWEIFNKTGSDVLKVIGRMQHPELQITFFDAEKIFLGPHSPAQRQV